MWPYIVLALLLIYAYNKSQKTQSNFMQMPGMTYINRDVVAADGSASKGGQPPGHIKYMGSFVDGAACENACAGAEWCRAYTWHHPAEGSAWSNQCFGLKSIDYTADYSGADSGHLGGVANAHGVIAEASGDVAAANGADASVSSADVVAAAAEHLTVAEASERVRRGWTIARERASAAAVNARFRAGQIVDGARTKFNNTMGRRLGGQSAGKDNESDAKPVIPTAAAPIECFSIQHPNRNDHCVGTFDCMYSHDGAAGQLSSGHFHEQLQAAWANDASPVYSAPGQVVGNIARQTNWVSTQKPAVLIV